MGKGISSRAENYSQWYNDLVIKGGLAEHSAVRGCMVIKPYGYAIWENMRNQLDVMFKATGHQNAYFPLFIPKSFLSKEAAHIEGFAKECAVVTHYRLKNNPDNNELIVDPEAKLEEELIVRPTSETIIWNTFRDWIKSYRDLPLKINQWANVVRWEMRTRLFLRTAEFLWQEGHTAHTTREEAIEETHQMLEVYAKFVEDFMAIPVIKGRKTESERFAGALDTLCIEALMQDGKALQAGTSHFLGQNFAKAFDVKFASKEGDEALVWATSWGVSTRLIGALLMAHSDDDGLIIPPRIAPVHLVIIPMFNKKNPEMNEKILDRCLNLKKEFEQLSYDGASLRITLDDDDTKRPGFKFAENELKGIPLRIVIGPRDYDNNVVELARRDTKEKSSIPLEGLGNVVLETLSDIQEGIFQKAKSFRDNNIRKADSYDEFKKLIKKEGGFVSAHWDGTPETEEKIKTETKATIRCIPLDNPQEEGKCIVSGKPSKERVLFAKAY